MLFNIAFNNIDIYLLLEMHLIFYQRNELYDELEAFPSEFHVRLYSNEA